MADEVQRFTQIEAEIQTLSGKQIRLEERFKSEKARLEKVLQEVTAKGIDPKNITEIRKAKETELLKLLSEIEAAIKDTKEKLDAIEVA